MTSVPETTSCRPALHQGALGAPPPAPPHSQAQEHTQTCAHTHTHARHAPGNACRRLRRDWLEGKRCARQRPLPLLDPGVSQGLGLEVKRDRDGAGETSCSPGLSWREGPGGIRGNCPAGLPAPLPSGGGASRPPVCVWGGVQDHPPGLAGERAPCSRLASPGPFESSRGRRPLPQDVLPGWRWGQLSEPLCSPEPPLPTLRSGPSWVPGRTPPIPASTPPSAVRENAGPLGLCTRCWRRNSRQRLHFPWAPASPRRREFGQMVRKPFSGRPPSVGHIVGHRANFRIA